MRLIRCAGLLLLAVAVSVLANPIAQASAGRDGRLVPAAKRLGGLTGGQLIGAETKLLLELPVAENPQAGNGESCFPAGHRGKVLIVWTRAESQAPAVCTVRPGTSVFLTGGFVFCDPLEGAPFFAVGERAQRKCAVEQLLTNPLFVAVDAILVAVDGRRPVDIKSKRFLAVSRQGTAQLPEDNILSTKENPIPPQETTFVTAAYVAMLRPLRPGVHTISVVVVGGALAGTNSATIDVVRGD